jgi:hypothetical protein
MPNVDNFIVRTNEADVKQNYSYGNKFWIFLPSLYSFFVVIQSSGLTEDFSSPLAPFYTLLVSTLEILGFC